jgi:predicted RNA-binding protein YlqC (UPF0109 family)
MRVRTRLGDDAESRTMISVSTHTKDFGRTISRKRRAVSTLDRHVITTPKKAYLLMRDCPQSAVVANVEMPNPQWQGERADCN